MIKLILSRHHYHHHHQDIPTAQIPLTLSGHPPLLTFAGPMNVIFFSLANTGRCLENHQISFLKKRWFFCIKK